MTKSRFNPTWIATTLVVLAASCGLHAATHGFRAWTSDDARQLAIANAPRALPSIELLDSTGQVRHLQEIMREHRYTVVALVYTQCTSLCLVMASSESFLQSRLRDAGMADQVGLLTISFDPSRDTPEVLARYARRVKAGSGWTVATVADPRELAALLGAFDVVVLPDGNGEFIHNGALFLVDSDGLLFDALAPDAPDLAFARVATLVASP